MKVRTANKQYILHHPLFEWIIKGNQPDSFEEYYSELFLEKYFIKMFTWYCCELWIKFIGGSICLLFNLKMLSAYPQLRMADHWMSVLFMLLTPPREWEIKISDGHCSIVSQASKISGSRLAAGSSLIQKSQFYPRSVHFEGKRSTRARDKRGVL